MPTSDPPPVYVWVWLPGAVDPVVAGVLRRQGPDLAFRYGRSYLERPDAISLFAPELPLTRDVFPPARGVGMPSAIKDAAPDAWGMRVILNQSTGVHGLDADVDALPFEAYLLESGSDRIGALDFQPSPEVYEPRLAHSATLDDLLSAAGLVEAGEPLPAHLSAALIGVTSIGGARPKALLRDEDDITGWVAKFPSSTDVYNVIGAEAASVYLAGQAGIETPQARMVSTLSKDVLLTRRFDRTPDGGRRLMVTGITMIGRGVSMIPDYSYPELLDVLRRHGDDAGAELFSRVAFNIAISNDDDHMRNQSAFWDGHRLTLTPAYDLSPGIRRGETMSLATALDRRGNREATFSALLGACHEYGLNSTQARERIDFIRHTIETHWTEAADFARLSQVDRDTMLGRQFLNRAASYGYQPTQVAFDSVPFATRRTASPAPN